MTDWSKLTRRELAARNDAAIDEEMEARFDDCYASWEARTRSARAIQREIKAEVARRDMMDGGAGG